MVKANRKVDNTTYKAKYLWSGCGWFSYNLKQHKDYIQEKVSEHVMKYTHHPIISEKVSEIEMAHIQDEDFHEID